MATEPYEIMTGVGRLYIAAVGTPFPALDEEPGADWRDLGLTQDGVTITMEQEIAQIFVDQENGPVKESRTQETMTIATSLAEATLENLADILGQDVITVAPGAGTIGTKEVILRRGAAIKTFALLFRGESAYGNWPAQYEIPRGYFGGNLEMEDTKDGNRKYNIEFVATVNKSGTTDAEKYGRLVMQSAEAL